MFIRIVSVMYHLPVDTCIVPRSTPKRKSPNRRAKSPSTFSRGIYMDGSLRQSRRPLAVRSVKKYVDVIIVKTKLGIIEQKKCAQPGDGA